MTKDQIINTLLNGENCTEQMGRTGINLDIHLTFGKECHIACGQILSESNYLFIYNKQVTLNASPVIADAIVVSDETADIIYLYLIEE